MTRRPHALLPLALCLAAFFASVPVSVGVWHKSLIVGWLIAIAAAIASLFAIAAVAGARLLTDERGRWSLSRLQLVAWTVLILSTFWAMWLARTLAAAADPLALDVDNNLWLLLGITGTSSVASSMILGRKQGAARTTADVPSAHGVTEGSLRDLFRGEDTGNADVLDMARVQMAFFTVVCLSAYFVACWRALAGDASGTVTFPPVSSDLVALLGISHATYLVNKNIDRPPIGV